MGISLRKVLDPLLLSQCTLKWLVFLIKIPLGKHKNRSTYKSWQKREHNPTSSEHSHPWKDMKCHCEKKTRTSKSFIINSPFNAKWFIFYLSVVIEEKMNFSLIEVLVTDMTREVTHSWWIFNTVRENSYCTHTNQQSLPKKIQTKQDKTKQKNRAQLRMTKKWDQIKRKISVFERMEITAPFLLDF